MVVRAAGEWVGTDDTFYLGQVEFGVLVGTSRWFGKSPSDTRITVQLSLQTAKGGSK